MSARALIVAAAMVSAQPALASGLVIALSQDVVEVTADFDGSDISIFGVIERNSQSVARGSATGLVIRVLGPTEEVRVQRRQRRLGIWTGGLTQTFRNFPSYVALKSTPLLNEDTVKSVLDQAFRPTRGAPVATEPFRDALITKRIEAEQFNVDYGAVTMLTDTFFRTRIRLPGTISEGNYTVDATLFSDGLPLETHSAGFTVRKVGLEQQIFALSRDRPLIYGLAAVALALVTGYVGGVVFKRN